ncbi:MAG: thioredoxin family protein [Terriglobales bacterium]
MRSTRSALLAALAAVLLATAGQAAPPPPAAPLFRPLQHWVAAVRKGDGPVLAAMYSRQPPPVFLVSTGLIRHPAREIGFWANWRRMGLTGLSLSLLRQRRVFPRLQEEYFQAALRVETPAGPRSLFLFVSQMWRREAAGWRIIGGSRTDLSRLRQPDSLAADLFPAGVSPRAEIAQAVARARQDHKRVLLIFGANWCYDCHVLNLALRHSSLAPLFQSAYEMVDIDVGEFNRNLDVAAEYHVPLQKGIPALAVLNSQGQLLYSQRDGQFQAARALGPEDLIRFLNRWKPPTG